MVSLTPALASAGRAAVEFGTPIVLQDSSKKGSSSFVVSTPASSPAKASCVTGCWRGSGPKGGFFIAASARCKPRAGSSTRAGSRFETALHKGKTKRRRRRGNGGSGGNDDSWEDLWLSSGNTGGFGGSDGGSGGNGQPWGSSGNDPFFHKALFEYMWVWQALCAASMLQSWYFMLFPQQSVVQLEAANGTDISARVGMAY